MAKKKENPEAIVKLLDELACIQATQVMQATARKEDLQTARGKDLADLHDEFEDKRKSLQRALDDLTSEEEALAAALMTPEIEAAIQEVTERYDTGEKQLNEQAIALEEQIISLVLAHQASVKGGCLQAVFTNGTKRWDNAKLEGYIASLPEAQAAKLLAFREQDEPRVKVSLIKGAKLPTVED